jgi:hypothetical protein
MNRLRIGLALAGFTAALLAVTLGDERVGWIGIGLLLASLLVRLSQKRTRKEDMDTRPDESDSV